MVAIAVLHGDDEGDAEKAALICIGPFEDFESAEHWRAKVDSLCIGWRIGGFNIETETGPLTIEESKKLPYDATPDVTPEEVADNLPDYIQKKT
ncbi:hypothetical protein HY970_04060 [Candidatus Kaiserbacteria bacterium]|nr:hypothetical protein [Candidatus Kaiserbacteria bacterium]